ncbi:MAG: hypothetical protein KJO79_02015 [Verrucomicrobiae bacterium]|nr:hypothetical protein [Verrucomicrobiae bacterium]NNJ85928.1 hypothetical protein [Akkermansiaceae bacterium]
MQLTKLDRWLKERFIYETHIFTLRLPEDGLPAGTSVSELEQNKGGDYRHRIVVKDNKLADQVIGLLRENHIMHATHVVEGKNWYNKRIAPEGKSFTYLWIFRVFALIGGCSAAYGVMKLWQNEALRTTIMDTINELKSGM